jgi:hypothetical protein
MRWTLIDRKWHPVDDGVLPYALAAMRSLWVWSLLRLWSAGMAPGQAGLPTWPVVFGLLAVSTAVAQFAAFCVSKIPGRGWPERRGGLSKIPGRGLVAFCGLVAVALALYLGLEGTRPALWDWRWLMALTRDPLWLVVTLLIAVWLWWWGVLAGRETIYYDTYAGNFALGTTMLGLAAVVSYATRIVPPGKLLGPALAFFAVSLATLAIASLRNARRYERDRSDSTFRVSRYWLATVGGVVVALLVVGLLLAQVFTPDVVRRLLAVASPLLDLLARALYWILLALAWVIFTLLDGLARLVRFRPGTEGEPPKIQMPPNFAEQLKDLETHPVGLAPGVYLALRIVAGLLIVGVILLIFALAFRRFRTYFEEDVEEVRESVLTLDLLKMQLAQIFRRKHQALEPPPFVVVVGDDSRARIRRTYQALLARAAAQGLPRPPGMTPEEYLHFVGQTLSDRSTALATITSAYMHARYSSEQIAPAVADEAARAWEQVANTIVPGRTVNHLPPSAAPSTHPARP